MLSSAANPIRVLLIDDHVVVRTGLRMLLESQPGLKVVGEAKNREEALAVATRERSDIILLDLNGASGIDLIPELLTAANGARILLFTGMRDVEAHQRAVRLGAMGIVSKAQTAEHVLKAIEKVHAGEVWLDRSLVASVLTDISRSRVEKHDPEQDKIALLTHREREVIALIGEGLRNRHIAERLSISETTVRHHLTSIFSKVRVSDRLELVIYAYRSGLASPPR